jgi:putative SOS response-associated peptidase YedK
VPEKPSFRAAFRRRRCLVVADGFYEWQKRPHGPKQPYYITVANGGPFGFAGLWERWSDPIDGYLVESCTIVTTMANERLEPIHDRMPVIIDPSDIDAWLDTSGNPAIAQALLAPYPAERMSARPISRRINKVKNDDPACLEPLEER